MTMAGLARAVMVAGLFAAAGPMASAAPPADPNLYLEQVDGARALAKVKSWNAATRGRTLNAPIGREAQPARRGRHDR